MRGLFSAFLVVGVMFPGLLSSQAGQRTASATLVVDECEGKACTPSDNPTWSFASKQGIGHFGTGDQPMLIEHLTSSAIAVRRKDVSGPVKGLEALYLGEINDGHVIGAAIGYPPGGGAPNTNSWYGVIRGSMGPLQKVAAVPTSMTYPFSIHECESDACLSRPGELPIVWNFESSEGRGWIGDHERRVAIEYLSGDMVIVRRYDGEALGGLTALNLGQVKGNRIIGAVLYYDRANPTVPRTDTWFGEITTAGNAQTATAGASAGPSAAISPVSSRDELARIPAQDVNVAIGMCEDADGCTNWYFERGHGTAKWNLSGGVANLSIERFDETSIRVLREDRMGASPGLTAVYSGTVDGFRIEGTVTAKYQGKELGPAPWHGIIRPPEVALAPPSKPVPAGTGWLICEDTGHACDGDHPVANYGWGLGVPIDLGTRFPQMQTHMLLHEDSMDPHHIVIRRIDQSGDFAGLTGLYVGTRQGDVMRGTATWMVPGSTKLPWHGTWVARLVGRTCTAPSAFPEEDMKKELLDIFQGYQSESFHCAQVAADAGNIDAQRNLVLHYSGGVGVPKNMAMAFKICKALADGGDATAMNMLASAYETGAGTPVDTLRAKYYAEQAVLTQQTQKRTNDPRAFLEGLFTSVIMGGTYTSGSTRSMEDRVFHRGNVIKYMDQGMSRLKAEEKAGMDDIHEAEEGVGKCQSYQRHLENDPGYQDAQALQRMRNQDARLHGEQEEPEDKHPCSGAASQLDLVADRARTYYQCAQKYVDSEAIEAHCQL